MVDAPTDAVTPHWTSLPDEQLLDVRMCDLDLRIEGTDLQHRISTVDAQLKARGLICPQYWISDEWFSPDGVPGVAVPFYLLHPRLAKLELSQMLEVEGGDEETCLKILRHEAGHAIDNAYQLRRRRARRDIFGRPSTPYPEYYTPKPYSKSFVQHLDHWYAQSHPDEDFAETFATWLDPSIEVAPFGMIPSTLRGKRALLLQSPAAGESRKDAWTVIPADLPFAASQHVTVDATIAADGKLTARLRYVLRGDNELLLRVAFHRSSREQWKGLAQLLAFSDGFRGQVTAVTASDPSATREPFTLEYEITQPAFVDWSKQPVRIPALLPLIGLPEVPARPASAAASPPIELGTPLDIEARATLHLPPRTIIRPTAGTSVARDYAIYTSSYSARGSVLLAARHVRFLLREIPAARLADYSAFVRAVQNDEAQLFPLERPAALHPKPAAPKTPPPAKPRP